MYIIIKNDPVKGNRLIYMGYEFDVQEKILCKRKAN